MKKLILSIATMAMIGTTLAQIPEDYEIATWQGFRKCAITYSFDDGTPNQIPVAIPLLDKYGFHGTFNLVSDWVKDWNQWKKVAEGGHEIASHTITHSNFSQLTAEQQTEELAKSKAIIEEKIGKECVTMVYPYCARGKDSIVADYYISARSCSGQIGESTPNNFFDITSRVVGTESDMQTAENFNNWVTEASGKDGWCVFLIHAIDNDGGYSPIQSAEFEEHLKFVKSSDKLFWVATFADITKYIIERNSLTITETPNTAHIDIAVRMDATSKLTKFDVPITVKRKLPDNCTEAIVSCNGQRIETIIENGYVTFDVVPGEDYTMTLI